MSRHPGSGRSRAARLSAAALAVSALAVTALAACGGADDTGRGPARTLRLGYLPNLTHATPLVGVAEGFYQHRLGGTRLSTQTFDAGPAAVEALFSGDLDAAYLGPSPAVNAWAKSRGRAIRIVAGATSGGAALVVRPGITTPADLRGRHVATPQLGNTQDVALRVWLRDHGLTPSSASGDGDVDVEPTDNATTLQLFRTGRLDGAWVPEPWASRLVIDGGGSVLVDERSLWPQGRFVTTHLVVRADFLERHRETVRALLAGQVDTNAWIAANPARARQVVDGALTTITGRPLSEPVLARAFDRIGVTDDPLAASLRTSAEHTVRAGLLEPVDLRGIYDLGPLNEVLAERHLPPVSSAGLGRER